jgi:hypothetical protein
VSQRESGKMIDLLGESFFLEELGVSYGLRRWMGEGFSRVRLTAKIYNTRLSPLFQG